MFLNVLIEEYHRVYHNIEDENSKMVCLRHEMDNGTVDAFELLKACVKNRHFDFLHLKRDEKACLINKVAKKLKESNVLYNNFDDFEALYQNIEELLGQERGIGNLMLYDITRMIGYAHKPSIIPIQYVYLQSGAKIGARKLLNIKRVGRKLPINIFKKYFPNEDSQHIEDILCIYKDDFNSKRHNGHSIHGCINMM